MKNYNNSHIKKVNQVVIGGLATFLIVGLGGCEDKDPNCKDLAYAPQWRIDECKQEESKSNSKIGHSNSGQTHSAGSSWLPLWLLMNNSNNAHNGYTYGSNDGPKNTSFFKSSSGSSSSSSGG